MRPLNHAFLPDCSRSPSFPPSMGTILTGLFLFTVFSTFYGNDSTRIVPVPLPFHLLRERFCPDCSRSPSFPPSKGTILTGLFPFPFLSTLQGNDSDGIVSVLCFTPAAGKVTLYLKHENLPVRLNILPVQLESLLVSSINHPSK